MNLNEINAEDVINEYNSGKSMGIIAKKYNTHTTTIKRILEKNNVKIRADIKKKGSLYVTEGAKLIEWAKAQGRLVTKAELAKIAGTKRLSPSYFLKYPELGQYVVAREINDLHTYNEKLYNWLKENDISYKPADKFTLGVTVTALLLGDYKNIALQIVVKSQYVSKKRHERAMLEKLNRAEDKGVTIIFLNEYNLENLDKLKGLLNEVKRRSN